MHLQCVQGTNTCSYCTERKGRFEEPHEVAQPCENPFVFHRRNRRIQICQGCRQHFRQPIVSPHEFVFQRKETYSFFNITTGKMQVTSGNRYYHVSAQCVLAKTGKPLKKEMLCIPPGLHFSKQHVDLFNSEHVDVEGIANKSLLLD